MIRSHEVPISLLEESHSFNDFDYALVHLFEKHPQYFNFYKRSLQQGRMVILDNSVFELGESYDENLFEMWIERLRPTYYIIPDKFGDADFTINSIEKWIKKSLPAKTMGVIQGKTIDDLIFCYESIVDKVDIVGISFAQPSFLEMFPGINKNHAYMLGRIYLINRILSLSKLREDKHHHLLGCSLPQELLWYKHAAYNFLKSVDTSSPIIHAMYDIKFSENGIVDKLPNKLADDILMERFVIDMELLYHNVAQFKKLMP